MATELQIEKKKAKLERALAASKGGAGEPLVRKESYKTDLMLAINWYNYNEEASRLSKWGIEYLKKNLKDEYIKFFSAGTDFEVKQAAILMRLSVREQYLAQEHIDLINSKLETLKAKYSLAINQKIEEKKSAVPAINVVSRVNDIAHKHMAEIDFEIDKFVTTKSSDFSLKIYIAKNGLSSAVTNKIGEFYKRLLKEVKEAIEGKDEQLVEGYSYFTSAQLKKFGAFIESIVQDCETQVLTAKANRAPRKQKEKPSHVQVAKLQYQQDYLELNLTSIHPTKIVGAQQLWTYNTKSKKLAVYYASGRNGFTVKGTSIQGWDIETSSQNGLRKPALTIAEVMAGTPMQLSKIIPKLTTITTKPNGRINSDTILLKVL